MLQAQAGPNGGMALFILSLSILPLTMWALAHDDNGNSKHIYTTTTTTTNNNTTNNNNTHNNDYNDNANEALAPYLYFKIYVEDKALIWGFGYTFTSYNFKQTI